MFYNYDVAKKLLYGSRNKDPIVAADNIIKRNEFMLPPIGRVIINIENNFKSNQTSRSYWRLVHGLTFLGDLFIAYDKTSDSKYIDKAVYLIESWFTYRQKNLNDKMIYHDETTALRLSYLMNFYYYTKDNLEQQFKEKIQKEIDDTVSLLMTDKFHSTNTNHGMFQDLSLLAFSILYYKKPKMSETYQKSVRRLLNYFLTCFTTDGVHKEHAPDYHFLVANYVKMVSDIILELGNRLTSEEEKLVDIYKKAESYSKFIILPDGSLPRISDCPGMNLSSKPTYYNLYNSEEFKFVKTKGKEGKKPVSKQKAFLKAGSFFSRSGWTEEDSYFLFLANYNGAYHKHTDDLSFILYDKRHIFVDSGPNGYNYDNKYTKYAYSGYAHSSLIVNGKTLPRTDGKMDKVGLDYAIYDDDGSTFDVKGFNQRYDNVSHTRRIIGDTNKKEYIIYDYISSRNRNQYKLLFQISYKLNLKIEENFVSIYDGDLKVAELEILNNYNNYDCSIEIINGQISPRVQGFEFPKMGTEVASNTVEVTFYNRNEVSEVTSIIRLKNFKKTNNDNERISNFGSNNVNYVLKEKVVNKSLIVKFSSNESNKFKDDNFTLVTNDVDCLELSINISLNEIRELNPLSGNGFESDIISLIYNIRRKYGIGINNIALLGEKIGAFYALFFGMKYGFENIVVVEPEIFIGDFLEKIYEKESNLITMEDADKIYFNNLFERMEIYPGYYKNFHIGVNYNSQRFKDQIQPFIRLLRRKQVGMNILAIPLEKEKAQNIAPYLNEYVYESLNDIYNFNNNYESELLKSIYDIQFNNLKFEILDDKLNIHLDITGDEFVIIYQFLDKFNKVLSQSKTQRSKYISIKENEFMNKRLKIFIRGRYKSFKLISNIVRENGSIEFNEID